MEDKLASKQDLKDLRQEMLEMKQDLQHSISELRSEVQHSIAQVESRLTIRMGTMLAASIAILTALQKLA